MSTLILRRRRILALLALLAMVGNAIWLFYKTRIPEPYFEFEMLLVAWDQVDIDYLNEFESAVPILTYKEGMWLLNGARVTDISPYIRRRGIVVDAADKYLVYYLDRDATMDDFARSTRDVWSAGAKGSAALMAEAFTDTPYPISGIEIYEPRKH